MAPPFELSRCLDGGVAADHIRRRHAKVLVMYNRGTWGRRWLLWLALRAGALLFVMAVMLLAAGRQLQHRCVVACPVN